jgi:hypothetical protein
MRMDVMKRVKDAASAAFGAKAAQSTVRHALKGTSLWLRYSP